MSKPLLFIGAGGHAKVTLQLANDLGLPILGCLSADFNPNANQTILGVPIIGNDDYLHEVDVDNVLLVNALGALPGDKISFRTKTYLQLKEQGFSFATLIHPSSYVASSAQLGEGVQVMARAVIQADAKIADNIIINSNSVVEHDCCIANHVHISPSATLCGSVKVAEMATVGAGATVLQGLEIGRGAVVAAGALLCKHLDAYTLCRGSKPTLVPLGKK